MAAARRRRQRAATVLKYANDVHDSGDAANAALMQHDGGARCAGMMVALERIRVLDEIRWVYGWSADMWREVIGGAQPSYAPPAPVDPDSLDALLDSAGTSDDLQGLLDDTVSSSYEQPRAAASSKRVTWSAAVSSPIGYGAHAASSQTRHSHQAPGWFDWEVSTRMYDCQHGWVCFEGECDTTLTPICDRAQCVEEARAEYQQHLTELAAGASSSSDETRPRPTLSEW